MSNQIKVNDQETQQTITINEPNFYGPAIPTQDIAYSDSSCSIQIGSTNPETINFHYPCKPQEDYELAMWNTLDSFETNAWQTKNVGIKTGFDYVDKAFEGGLYPGFIIIGGDSNLGKCLVHDSEIVDANTGEIKTIEQIYQEQNNTIFTLGDNKKLKKTKPSHFIDDGIKPVYKITTALGRTIKTTITHPFLTIKGWEKLMDIQIGEHIAVPRELPVFGKDTMPEHELRLMGFFIADGSLMQAKCNFTKASPYLLDEFKRCCLLMNSDTFFREEYKPNNKAITINVSDKTQQKNPIKEWAIGLGINTKSIDKVLPKSVFTLTKKCLSELLKTMFSCDGTIYKTKDKNIYTIGYCSSSKTMIYQLQHLLLRFGLMFKVRQKNIKLNKKNFISYELEIHDSEQVIKYIEEIGFFDKEDMVEEVKAGYSLVLKKGANKDIIPKGIWKDVKRIKEEGNYQWKDVAPYLNYQSKYADDIPSSLYRNNRNAQRKTIKAFGDAFNNDYLKDIACSDVYWDEIISIEYMGEEQVYDLTIPDTHNFIANDICVHNTAFLTQLAWGIVQNNQNVYVMDLSLDDAMPDKLARVAACSGQLIINAVKTPLNYVDYPLMLIRRKNAILNLRSHVGKYRAYDSTFSTFVEDIEKEIEEKLIMFDAQGIDKQLVVCIDNFHDLNISSQPGLQDKAKFDFLAQWCSDMAIKHNIVIICSAELKKLNGNRRPMLDDLRESVKIKYEAKAVLLVYNEVHYKGDSSDIFYMKNGSPFKQPVFEVHFAKNKFGTYKGRAFYEFYPEMAYMKECAPQVQKTYSQIIFG